jgi:S-ribosylhomocysteine lyase
MEQIESFSVNHLKLRPGIYVSRKDTVNGSVITTFDIRITRPNHEPVMNTAEIHTIEHLGATYLRNRKDIADQVIYFGPMGCRTGFYLILAGDYASTDIVDLLDDLFMFVTDYEDDIPGASAIECGNYLDMNLPMAKVVAQKFLDEVITNISDRQLSY